MAEGTTLNLFGKGVNQFRTSAVGAGKINPRYTIDLLTALREGGVFGVNEELPKFYRCDRDAIPQAEVITVSYTHLDVYKRQVPESLRYLQGLWYLYPHLFWQQ